MKKTVALILSLVMIMGMLAGCGKTETKEPDSPPPSEGVGVIGDTEKEPADEPETVESKYGGVLVYSPGMQNEQNMGYPAGDTNMLMNMNASPALETLFRLDASGNLVCWLAESYDVTDDGLHYTINLRKGVTFHDGTAMDAEAVAWNLQMNLDNGKAQFNRVESIETEGDSVVKVNMSQADVLFLPNLASDPCGLIISPSAFEKNGAEWCEKNPVGTGPFVFQSWENDVKVVYTRNDHYWGVDADGNQLPYLDGIECIYMTENAVAEAALEADEVMMWVRSDADSTLKFIGKPGFIAEKAGVPSGNFNLVACTETDNPAANKDVREAILYAVNFEEIVDALYSLNFVATKQNSLPGRIYYNDKLTTREYNPEKAKELLAKAGYADGVEITFHADNSSFSEKLFTAMSPYLEAVGITMKINLLDMGGYFDLMVKDFSDGFLLGGYTYAPDEFGKMYALASNSAALKVINTKMDDETYQMFEDAKGCATLDEAAEIVKQIQESIYGTNLYFISVMTSFDTVISHDYVHDTGFYTCAGFHWTPETAYITK